MLNDFYSYNRLPAWNFVKLAEGFGAEGRRVENEGELKAVFEEIDGHPDSNFVVEIIIPAKDSPSGIRKIAPTTVGEDEDGNPNWPPYGKF